MSFFAYRLWMSDEIVDSHIQFLKGVILVQFPVINSE
ncbi:hypothetical protein QFZ87_000128 [Bacillus sp. SLBN-46]|nr:hypothetical protein [Bacillus sp. SLBN-46]